MPIAMCSGFRMVRSDEEGQVIGLRPYIRFGYRIAWEEDGEYRMDLFTVTVGVN